MKNKIVHIILFVSVTITFLIPLIQLSIGFHFVVKDGQDASEQCSIAPDLPLLLAIGGVFTLFFLGIAYVLLHIISTNNQQSDMAGRVPKILIGLIAFIFGSITFLFFLLIQLRIYDAYSNTMKLISNSCQIILLHGGFIFIILNYINLLILLSIYIFVFIYRYVQKQTIRLKEFEMKIMRENERF